MNFYGIEFLKNQSSLNDYIKYLIIFGALILLILVFSLYLRHRINTKYRDLSIIFFLILMFVLGVQYSDYQTNQTKHSQSSQMVTFLEGLTRQENININQVYVNATQFSDGIIVKLNDVFYKINLSNDQNSYTLTETYLMTDNIVYSK